MRRIIEKVPKKGLGWGYHGAPYTLEQAKKAVRQNYRFAAAIMPAKHTKEHWTFRVLYGV